MQTIILNNVEYREVPGYPHYYVSAQGEVYSMKRSKILPNKKLGIFDYPVQQLYIDNKTTCVPTHKLVALAWCPVPEDMDINELIRNYYTRNVIVEHIDGNKNNNTASNLKWTTKRESKGMETIKNVNRDNLKGNNNAKGHKSPGATHRYIYTYYDTDYTISELRAKLNCSKSAITEQFRKNYGLVKAGILTRREK